MSKPLGNRPREIDAKTLRPLLAYATTPSGVTDHGSLAGLGDDDHSQYVHISVARSITAQHTFAPGATQPPFVLGANAQGQKVIGLDADLLDDLNTSSNPGASAAVLVTDGAGQVIVLGLSVLSDSVVVNDAGNPGIDFRVEGDTNAFMIFVDAGLDKIGFLTSTLTNAQVNIGGTVYISGDARFDGSVVINETGAASADFRVEGDTNDNMIFVDASLDKIGLRTNTLTNAQLNIDGTVYGSAEIGVGKAPSSDTMLDIALAGITTYSISTDSGHIVFNETGAAESDVRMESDSYSHLFFLDAGVNKIGINQPAPDRIFEILDNTSPQLRLTYTDSTYYADFQVDGGGSLIVTPTGDFIFDPAGNDILPQTNYDLNLGSNQKKYLTIHAAELWVETLVASDVRATIGGRVVVAPTTELIDDFASGSTTVDVKHNQMSSGDRVWMEGEGKFEFIAITSEYTAITGGYRYNVTRNLDGTGANDWYKGDALVNTGQTGSGFIDMYSQESVFGRSPDYIYNFNYNGGIGSQYSSNYAGSVNWQPFADGAGSEVNDAIYVGNATTFGAFYVWITTAASHVLTIVCEYWNGAAWASVGGLSVELDGAIQGISSLFEGVGTWVVSYSIPGSWATTTINGRLAYWLRFRISVYTSFTTIPQSRGRHAHVGKAQWGPSIVGFRRNSSTFNDVTEHWAVGNLNGLYDFGLDVMGAAFGRYGTTTGFTWVSVDDANGFRIMDGSEIFGQWDTAGIITVGNTTTEHIRISPTSVQIKDGTSVYTDLTAGALTLGLSTAENVLVNSSGVFVRVGSTVYTEITTSQILVGDDAGGEYVQISSSGVFLYGGGNANISLLSTGNVLLGREVTNYGNALWDATSHQLKFRGGTNGTVIEAYVDTTGALMAGGGVVKLDSDGLTITDTGDTTAKRIKFVDSTDIGFLTGYTSGSVAIARLVSNLNGPADNGRIALDVYNESGALSTQLLLNAGLAGESITMYTGGLITIQPDGSGVLIDQVGGTGAILEFKSNTVAHGITSFAETDTYVEMYKIGSEGGLQILSLAGDASSTQTTAFLVLAGISTSADTGKTTGDYGIVRFDASIKSGTSLTAVGTDGNLFSIDNAGSTRIIVDAEGDLYYFGSLTAFDDYNDVSLIRSVEVGLMKRGIDGAFRNWVDDNRETLHRAGIVTEGGFINATRLQRLQNGAIWQLHERIERLENALRAAGIEPEAI